VSYGYAIGYYEAAPSALQATCGFRNFLRVFGHYLNGIGLNLKTAVNAGGFAQSFVRLGLALSAPRTARCASGKRKPHPPQNLAQTLPAELPFLGL
jgi:hypothetical protein